jgi:hypothetical protein
MLRDRRNKGMAAKTAIPATEASSIAGALKATEAAVAPSAAATANNGRDAGRWR